jgi:hypothetical protein
VRAQGPSMYSVFKEKSEKTTKAKAFFGSATSVYHRYLEVANFCVRQWNLSEGEHDEERKFNLLDPVRNDSECQSRSLIW